MNVFWQVKHDKYVTPSNKNGLLGKGVFEDIYVVARKNELFALKIPRQKEYASTPDSMDSESTL